MELAPNPYHSGGS